MPDKSTVVATAKSIGWGSWFVALYEWMHSITLDEVTKVLVCIGAFAALVAYLYDIKCKRLEARLKEIEINEHEQN